MGLSLLLSFAVPAVLAHFGVGAAVTGVLGATAGKVATRAIGGVAAKGVKQLLQHIYDGGQVSEQQRDWVKANAEALYVAPKQTPGDPGPAVWELPRTT